MKQKSMIRKTAPLITPWDSGLWPSSKSGEGGGKGERGRGHSLIQAVPSPNLVGKGTTTGIPDTPKGATFRPPSLPQY